MAQTLQKHFEFEVTANEVSDTFRLLEDVEHIHSMQLTSSDMGRLYDEGISFELSSDGREVLPPDNPVKPYLADSSVPVPERFFPLVENFDPETGRLSLHPIKRLQGNLKFRFTSAYGGVPYKVQVVFKCIGKQVF